MLTDINVPKLHTTLLAKVPRRSDPERYSAGGVGQSFKIVLGVFRVLCELPLSRFIRSPHSPGPILMSTRIAIGFLQV